MCRTRVDSTRHERRQGEATDELSRGDKLPYMSEDRRTAAPDRRAHSRNGRRSGDAKKPWYMRRRLWLATASLLYVGWRRVRALGRRDRYDMAA